MSPNLAGRRNNENKAEEIAQISWEDGEMVIN